MIEWVGADAYAYGQFANYRIICRLDNATSQGRRPAAAVVRPDARALV